MRNKYLKLALNSEKGQSLLELALTLPLLLALASGLVTLGQAYYEYNTLSKSVREAARYMSSNEWDPAYQTTCQKMAVYGNTGGTGSPILPSMTISNINIMGRTEAGSLSAFNTFSKTTPPDWVTVNVAGYTFTGRIFGMIPLSISFTPSVEMRYVGLNAKT